MREKDYRGRGISITIAHYVRDRSEPLIFDWKIIAEAGVLREKNSYMLTYIRRGGSSTLKCSWFIQDIICLFGGSKFVRFWFVMAEITDVLRFFNFLKIIFCIVRLVLVGDKIRNANRLNFLSFWIVRALWRQNEKRISHWKCKCVLQGCQRWPAKGFKNIFSSPTHFFISPPSAAKY